MFSIVDALLIHPVSYPEPETLAFVWSHDSQGSLSDASAADFMDWRAQSKTLSDFAAWMPTSFVLTGGDRPRQISGARVSANFFRTLGVKPQLGRTFLPDEDGLDHPENAAHSAVISHRLWQEDLGADPKVLGSHDLSWTPSLHDRRRDRARFSIQVAAPGRLGSSFAEHATTAIFATWLPSRASGPADPRCRRDVHDRALAIENLSGER